MCRGTDDYGFRHGSQRYEHHEGAIYPLVLSFGAKRTSDAQMKITRKIKERASRIEKAYKFALHDKVDFDGAMEWLARYDKMSGMEKNLRELAKLSLRHCKQLFLLCQKSI